MVKQTGPWWVAVAGLALLGACGPEAPPAAVTPAQAGPSVGPSVAPSALPSTLALGPNRGLGIGEPRTVEEFDGPALDPSVWTFLPGPGKQSFENGLVRHFVEGRQTAFPYAYTRKAIIPPNGTWAVEWAFLPLKMSSLQSFVLDYFPPSGFDVKALSDPYLSVSMLNERIKFTSPALGGVFYSEGLFLDKIATVRIEGRADDSGQIFVNGKPFLELKAYPRPLRFRMGSQNVVSGPWQDWGQIQVDYLVAGSLTRSALEDLPASAARPDGASSGAVAEVVATAGK